MTSLALSPKTLNAIQPFRQILKNKTLKSFCKLRTVTGTQFSAPSASDIQLSYTIYPYQARSIDDRKRPLVFLHGLFGAKGNLHSISKLLSSNDRKLITYDARNHGNSQHSSEMNYKCMAQDLSRLIADLNLSRPVVMGHSMGGKTAMTFALSQPDNLAALIVADITPGQSSGVDTLKKYAECMKSVKFPDGITLVQARQLAQSHLASVVENQAILQFLLTNLRHFEGGAVRWRVNLDAFLNNYDHIKQFPLEKANPFTKPTLFVFGENSIHFKEPSVDRIKTLFPNAEIVAISGAGHFVHSDKPHELVKVVNQFLQKVDDSSEV